MTLNVPHDPLIPVPLQTNNYYRPQHPHHHHTQKEENKHNFNDLQQIITCFCGMNIHKTWNEINQHRVICPFNC